MKQLTFDFGNIFTLYESDFIITSANIDAYSTVTSGDWPSKRLLLIGPRQSGKTHLTNVFLKLFPEAKVIEDIEKIEDEAWLFHRINEAYDGKKHLLLTSNTIPQFHLPDLKSRINATLKVLIKPPTDEALEKLLMAFFKRKQLELKDEIILHLLNVVSRSYSFISFIVEKLDKCSLEQKKSITIPLINAIIASYDK